MSHTAQPLIVSTLFITALLSGQSLQAAEVMQVDKQQVKEWNRFAERLHQLHDHLLQNHQVYKESETGGYANRPDFYKEVRYYDKETGRLLSRIQREKGGDNAVHSIAVYVYDQQGELLRDYLAAYLPRFRNAPVQTLVNMHYSDKELRSFRQFDASGNRIYEQCRGEYFGEPFMVSLEENEISARGGTITHDVNKELYQSCFSEVSAEAGKYLDPLSGYQPDVVEQLPVSEELERLTWKIERSPDIVENYVLRSRHWLDLHEFEKAIADLDHALRIDDDYAAAYFWRGMAHGRNGQIEQGIADLSAYIDRVPDSSHAYTKRGVRYIWNGEIKKAKRDLLRAIELDGNNAEAHDDLGVIYAQQEDYDRAISHFEKAVDIDPDYQKAYHNLAMTYFIQNEYLDAFRYIDKALALSPNSKISLKLKAEILKATGRGKEADRLLEKAARMPDGNWTEQWPDQAITGN